MRIVRVAQDAEIPARRRAEGQEFTQTIDVRDRQGDPALHAVKRLQHDVPDAARDLGSDCRDARLFVFANHVEQELIRPVDHGLIRVHCCGRTRRCVRGGIREETVFMRSREREAKSAREEEAGQKRNPGRTKRFHQFVQVYLAGERSSMVFN